MSNELQDDYKAPISNEEMIRVAKQQYEQKKVSEYKFPTEVVELPSNGLLYPSDNPLSSGRVEMKYMTAKEEDILTTSSYIRDGSVLDRLFKSLIVGNGEGIPIRYNDLTTGDKNAIMIAARILGYGKDYEVEIFDPFSNNKQIDTIDLTQFENKPYDSSKQIEPNKNEFEFILPHSGRKITFMVMTELVDKRIKKQNDAIIKRNRKLKDSTSRELTTRLKNIILSVDDDYEQKVINHFVDNELFALDSKALRTFVNDVTPDIDLTYEFVSEQTGERRDMLLPMGTSFFWPKTWI